MKTTRKRKGDVWRTFLSTWRVDEDDVLDVSFPFSAGFGCGQSMKVAQGQKLSLQTQCKIGSTFGGKLGAAGTEASASVSGEISETLAYEISAGYEWSYISRACQYCTPRAHFPDARVQIISKFSLHVPLFVTRRTVFVPGESYEIRGHCYHAPEKCGGCKDAETDLGGGAVLTSRPDKAVSQLERVAFADRSQRPGSPEKFLQELSLAPGFEDRLAQLYIVGLSGEVIPVGGSEREYALYSLDDVDRSMGAVRIYTAPNELIFLSKDSEHKLSSDSSAKEGTSQVEVELIDLRYGEHVATGQVAKDSAGGLRMLSVRLDATQMRGIETVRDTGMLSKHLETKSTYYMLWL
jgi:hypothetical protein